MNTQLAMQTPKRTPLYDCHRQLGARFTEFGGWEMPVQYSSVIEEHQAVRKHVGLFDVSHMGEITITGPSARSFLQYVTSNDIEKLQPGRAQYTLLLNHTGGVVDDIIVYQLGADDYFLCVNAANTDKDFNWIVKQNTFGATVKNVSADYAQIAVQGPKAEQVVTKLVQVDLSPTNFRSFSVAGFAVKYPALARLEILLARTGYTGEDGFEIFVASDVGAALWAACLEIGKEHQMLPAGLGARDTLRLEACYPLHGHELRDDLTALCSGMGWVVKLKKGDFIGRDALTTELNAGLKQKLIGLEVLDPGIIREGARLYDNSGKEIGWVSSGTKPPTVNKAIGLGFVKSEFSETGTEFLADVRGKKLCVRVINTPFYKRKQ